MSTKDGESHRKRHKSESDSMKHADHRNDHHKTAHKASDHHNKTDHHSKSDHHSHSHKDHHHKSDHHHHHHHHRDLHHRDHHRGDHPTGDHHTSASGHPIRPRANTLSRKDTGHSIHHESDRRSTGTADYQHLIELENTYKLVPDCRFQEGKIKKIIQDVLKEHITEKEYDPSHCGQKCVLLSEIIKERVKHLEMDRFKIVCVVIIGQESEQSMLISSRCLWDHRFDNSVSSELKRGNIFALGLVFAVYAE